MWTLETTRKWRRREARSPLSSWVTQSDGSCEVRVRWRECEAERVRFEMIFVKKGEWGAWGPISGWLSREKARVMAWGSTVPSAVRLFPRSTQHVHMHLLRTYYPPWSHFKEGTKVILQRTFLSLCEKRLCLKACTEVREQVFSLLTPALAFLTQVFISLHACETAFLNRTS